MTRRTIRRAGAGLLVLLAGIAWRAPVSTVRAQVASALQAPVLADAEQHHQVMAAVLSRVVPVRQPRSQVAWERERDRLRAKVLDTVILRGVPDAWRSGAPRVELFDTISTACGYEIRKLRYEVVPGLSVPAILYLPTGPRARRPAVVNFQGHVETPGKATDYIQQLGHRLAQQGYVVLAPDWPGYGELKQPSYSHDRLSQLDLVGISGQAVFYLTTRRAIDYLVSRDDVDASRIAVTGLSGGGWQSLIVAAFDQRVALTAPVSGFIGLAQRVEVENIGDLEQNAVDLHQWADYTHFAAFVPPRPMLAVYNAKDQCCFRADRAERSIVKPLRPFYELFGAGHRFDTHVNYDPGSHNYEEDNQRAFLEFLSQQMPAGGSTKGGRCSLSEGLVDPDRLRVGVPPTNATFRTLALENLRERTAQAPPASRDALKAVIRFERLRASGRTHAEWSTRSETNRLTRLTAGGFSMPAVEIRPASTSKRCLTILVADAGRTAMDARAAELVAQGCTVVALELLLHGREGRIHGADWYAQLLSTVGLRPLGIQAAQLLAAAEYYGASAGATQVEAHGPRAGLAALVAAAIGPQTMKAVTVHGLPKSLVELLESDLPYARGPELFTFELLPRFDVAALQRLATDHPSAPVVTIE
ncbi:MAG: hypothetical protein GEU99_05205 [Luteitalea sp.]|nr:hypothetical protein [Luteitalea sp.]